MLNLTLCGGLPEATGQLHLTVIGDTTALKRNKRRSLTCIDIEPGLMAEVFHTPGRDDVIADALDLLQRIHMTACSIRSFNCESRSDSSYSDPGAAATASIHRRDHPAVPPSCCICYRHRDRGLLCSARGPQWPVERKRYRAHERKNKCPVQVESLVLFQTQQQRGPTLTQSTSGSARLWQVTQQCAEVASAGRRRTYDALLQAGALEHGHPDIGPAGEVHHRVLVLQVGQQELI